VHRRDRHLPRLDAADPSGELELINQATAQQESDSLLRPVWRDGRFLVRQTFPEIRERLHPKR